MTAIEQSVCLLRVGLRSSMTGYEIVSWCGTRPPPVIRIASEMPREADIELRRPRSHPVANNLRQRIARNLILHRFA